MGKYYLMVLRKPIKSMESKYYDLLDNGWFDLDSRTEDNTTYFELSNPIESELEIPIVGIDEEATIWAKELFTKIMKGERCIEDFEYTQLLYSLPGFWDLGGQTITEYLNRNNTTTDNFPELIKGYKLYKSCKSKDSIPIYNKLGKGYNYDDVMDLFNYDDSIIEKLTDYNSQITANFKGKYLKPNQVSDLLSYLDNTIDELIQQKSIYSKSAKDIFLIKKIRHSNAEFFPKEKIINILFDFRNWLLFWTGKGNPIGLQLRLFNK